jgi:hypothetical protein
MLAHALEDLGERCIVAAARQGLPEVQKVAAARPCASLGDQHLERPARALLGHRRETRYGPSVTGDLERFAFLGPTQPHTGVLPKFPDTDALHVL